MKVEHLVPAVQPTDPPEVPGGMGGIEKANLQDPHPRLNMKASAESKPEDPQPHEDASIPASERLDADLAFEREELLRPDSHTVSHGPKVWKVKGLNLKLSALEATVAVKRGVFTYDDFEV
jgi:hypothetical protein